MYLQQKNNKRKGFTLVEMLIAVFIFTISLTSLMNISSKGLKTAKNAEKQVVADYLAIEAIEAVRNMRDTSFLRNLGGSDWQTVFQGGNVFGDKGCFDDGVGASNSCNLLLTSNAPILDACTNCNVYVNPTSFYYTQSQNDGAASFPEIFSGYQRRIKIKEISFGQIMVFVTVTWDGGEVTYSENLFLWQ